MNRCANRRYRPVDHTSTTVHISILTEFAAVTTAIAIAGIIHIAAVAFACLLTDVGLKQIALFVGKPLLKFETRFAPITVGWVPISSFVKLDMESFSSKQLLTRCTVTVVGPIALLAVSAACLGPIRAAHFFATTYRQLVDFIISPTPSGKAFASFLTDHILVSPISTSAIIAAKLSAINFLPFGHLAGGRLLIQLARKRNHSVVAKILNPTGVAMTFVVLTCVAISMIFNLIHNY